MQEPEIDKASGTFGPQPKAFEVLLPDPQTAPVVFASPHSGRLYPEAFIQAARPSAHDLRRSEDAYVDQLFESVHRHGAPLLRALFPRAYVDANREAFELDPEMFSDPLPQYVVSQSSRISAGLGTVPKIVMEDMEIYDQPLEFSEVKSRIEATHAPYHRQLKDLIEQTREQFGGCLLVDCHSMPSAVPSRSRPYSPKTRTDIILGDRHGISLRGEIMARVVTLFTQNGFSVERNKPYAGGYTTRHYAGRDRGIQTLQIEINRALYMDEETIELHSDIGDITARLDIVIQGLCQITSDDLAQNITNKLRAAE